jgi:hypothetical protein
MSILSESAPLGYLESTGLIESHAPPIMVQTHRKLFFLFKVQLSKKIINTITKPMKKLE